MKLSITQRRKEVASMMLKGSTISVVAELLGVPRTTIASDMKAINDEWKEHYLKDMDAFKARSLAQYDKLIDDLDKAWQESRTDDKPAGDHAFSDAIERCIEKRAKIAGLMAQNGVVTVNNPVVVHSQDFFKKIEQSAEQLRSKPALPAPEEPKLEIIDAGEGMVGEPGRVEDAGSAP